MFGNSDPSLQLSSSLTGIPGSCGGRGQSNGLRVHRVRLLNVPYMQFCISMHVCVSCSSYPPTAMKYTVLYAWWCAYTCIFNYTHLSLHPHMYSWTLTHSHTHTHAHTLPHTRHIQITRIHTYMYMYTYTHTHSITHTHTHTLPPHGRSADR